MKTRVSLTYFVHVCRSFILGITPLRKHLEALFLKIPFDGILCDRVELKYYLFTK